MGTFSNFIQGILLIISALLFLSCTEERSLSGKYENNGYVFLLNSDHSMEWSYKENKGAGRWFINEVTLHLVHNDGAIEEFWIEDDRITNKITSIIFKKSKK